MTTEYLPQKIYKNRLLRKLACFLSSLLLVVMGVFLWPNIAFLSDITSDNIIKLTNQERLAENKALLIANKQLTEAAHAKAKAIIESQKFQHNIEGQKFSTWIKDAGYEYSFIGENLAIDFVTTEGVTKAWLSSPTHKKNLLNERFTEIGVAVVDGTFKGEHSIIVVQIFGTPINQSPTLLSSEQFNSALDQGHITYSHLYNKNTSSDQFLINSVISDFSNKKFSVLNTENPSGAQLQTLFYNKVKKFNDKIFNTGPEGLLYTYYIISLFGVIFLALKTWLDMKKKKYSYSGKEIH